MGSGWQWGSEIFSKSALMGLDIRSPFTIPSGVITTAPGVIARVAADIPEIGFLTTKTLSIVSRPGYREPIVHEYHPGCFINAVGLANPGAENFRDAMLPLLPLAGNKPLFVSIMGNDPEEFFECARILDPIADAFELNLSCPHVKGAGQSVGSDPELVRSIVGLLARHLTKPIVPKLSPNLPDLRGMARLCAEEGAAALCLINTVGPGVATDVEGHPILSNVAGGLSGAGILPIGLKAVREVASAVRIPIIAAGGIASGSDVRAYREAGASLFSVGSALAGMTTAQVGMFFKSLVEELESHQSACPECAGAAGGVRTAYFRTRILENIKIGEGMFQLRLEDGPCSDPGRFFFLRLPGIGEKPFSPARDREPIYLVRTVGPFTAALEGLKPRDFVYLRGPYGNGFPTPRQGRRLVVLGGGTGAAPVLMAAERWPDRIVKAFFGFSRDVSREFRDQLKRITPNARIVVDPPDRVGEVMRSLIEDVAADPHVYEDCQVFMCGPGPMTRAAAGILQGTVPGEDIFIAREDVMRCGIGLCGSCATETGLRSCVDGPVMSE